MYNYSRPRLRKGEPLAKVPAKKVEDAARLRYIRVLERFTGSITKYLFKAEAPSRDEFDKKVDNNRKYLDRVEKIKEDILYTANQIEKSMNRRRYKKDKHSSDMFKDWE